METVNERELILQTLLLVVKENEYSQTALSNVLTKYQYLDKTKRAFITRVVNGTLEREIELTYILNQFSSTPVSNMRPVIACLLLSGVYELTYMDQAPAFAVIDERVKLAKKKGFAHLSGFVNGVLRNISRHLDEICYPDPDQDPVAALSVKYSLPDWLIKRWLATYDQETIRKMGADFLTEKPVCVRFDERQIDRSDLIRKLNREGVTVETDATLSCVLYLSGYDHLEALPSFLEGDYIVQDVSSVRVGLMADPKPDDRVLDVCAAPGGKAIHMAQLLGGSGQVEARDKSESKVQLIRENIDRCGLSNIRTRCFDATVSDPESVCAWDIVLADLPCSGLGTLGKKPDIKRRMTPEELAKLSALQRQILSVVQTYVKPGGKLLYSTCTIDRAENEDNTRWFLETCPKFTLVKEAQSLPGVDDGDGFYRALFVRQ